MIRRDVFFLSAICIIIVFFSCQGSLPGAESWRQGSLAVSFSLGNSKDVRVTSDDFSLADSGTVFLKQSGVTKKQTDLTINTSAKTGSGQINDITPGNYDIVLELYDSATKLLYDSVSTVTIAAGDNGTKTMSLVKVFGTLAVSGSWTEEISEQMTGSAELRQGSTTIYGTSLSVENANKTMSGSFGSVYPDSYDLYVALRGAGGVLKFEGAKTITTMRGSNAAIVTLVVKTGSIAINVDGDATAPQIVNGPYSSIDGSTATIAWTTDEPATSLVCYSSTSEFDYQSSLNWAPLGGDLLVDTSSHSVTIEGLTEGATYYYVVLSADAAGNVVVSDEKVIGELIWHLATSSAPWSGRYLHASVIFDNKIWVLGGICSGTVRKNDIWWSSDGINWTMATGEASWQAREGLACVVFADKMWITGGFTGSYLNDVWSSVDGVNWTQVTASAPWVARYLHTSVVFDGKMWILGGAPGGQLNDVWSSGNGVDWSCVTSSAAWPARNGHASVVYNSKLWVLGGSTGNDVWCSVDGITWNQSAVDAAWRDRWLLSGIALNGKIGILGGSEYWPDPSTYEKDLWWSSDGANWELDPATVPWDAREGQSAVVFNNRVWLIGGISSDRTYMNDVWYYGP